MGISSLRPFLQSLCCNSPWNYAVFWKLMYEPEMVLAWEDSFCDVKKQRDSVVPLEDFYFENSYNTCPDSNSTLVDGSGEYPIGLAVAEMSSASHVFGKGLVGVAAFTGVPRWIYSDNIATNLFDSFCVAEYPDEWLLQFVAGVKTILILPVIPHGVLQLGSVEMVAEDAVLVSFVKQYFESYKRFDGYGTESPVQKISLMPTNLENLEEPSNITTNNRSEDQKTIYSYGRKDSDIFVANELVPAFMVQDLCNTFIAGLADSYENLIGNDSRLQSLDHLTCEDNKSESANVPFKPSCPNEKVRTFPRCDDLHSIKHDKFVNELSDFSFKEGSIELDSIGGDLGRDCESGSTLLSIPSEFEIQKALGSAVVGYTKHMYDSPISGPCAFRSSRNNRDLNYWMNLSGAESGAFTQKDDEVEHLLETAIADGCSGTNDTSPVQPNPATVAKMAPGKVLVSSAKLRNKLRRSAGEGNTAPCLFASAFIDMEINPVPGLSHSTSSMESAMTALIDKQQQRVKESHCLNPRKGSRLSSSRQRNLCAANNQRSRPRDRQLIQDHIKELRDIVPNSDKCSIDGLLDKTIKHMLFLRDVTNQAAKLRRQVLKEDHNTTKAAEMNRVNQNGTSWAIELGNENHLCPIVVKDLDHPGQMLIEMLCADHGQFLEIADVIQRLQLTVLKAVMETDAENSWARFIVEATGSFHRLDIFWPLMQLLKHPTPVESKA